MVFLRISEEQRSEAAGGKRPETVGFRSLSMGAEKRRPE